MKPLSLDLRQRIIHAVKHENNTPQETAKRFSVHLSSVYRFLQLKRNADSLIPAKIPGRPRLISAEQENILVAQIQMYPDATLEEHCQYWFKTTKRKVSVTTMFSAIRNLNFTLKKDDFSNRKR
jgi:transposase